MTEMPGCPECGGVYKCALDCGTNDARITAIAIAEEAERAKHRVEEEQRGEKIAEGEDGVYVRDHGQPNGPIVVAFNQGGHDCTIVNVEDVLDWVRRRRPDLLRAPVEDGIVFNRATGLYERR